MGALSFSLHYEYTSLGAVALGAVALGAVALVAAAGSASATGTPAGSDALLKLLQLETDMLHNFPPPFCRGLERLRGFVLYCMVGQVADHRTEDGRCAQGNQFPTRPNPKGLKDSVYKR